MALKIKGLQREPTGAMYVAPERICVTADGEIVGEDDVRAVRLLVAKGCEIPASEAALYGLIAETTEVDVADAADAAAAADAGAPAPEEDDQAPKRAKK